MKEIILKNGGCAIVDDEDYIILSTMIWWGQKSTNSDLIYPVTRIDGRVVYMSKFLVNPPKGVLIDHRNGNGLDHRKINLRCCSHLQNMANKKIPCNNTTGFKGVSVHKNNHRKPYRASLKANGKNFSLGYFSTKEEAARIYDEAAIKHFGDFARTNRMLGLLK